MADAAVAADIIRLARYAVTLQIAFARTHDAAHAADRDCHQRGVAKVGDADGDIDPLIDEIDDAVDEQRINGDLGIAPEELVHDGRQVASAERHRGGDGE